MSETSNESTPMTQAEHDTWVREQFQRANAHLAQNGVLFESVVVEASRYLAPYVAVWKIKSQQGKFFWVLSGDLPADYVPFDVAPDVEVHYVISHSHGSSKLKILCRPKR